MTYGLTQESLKKLSGFLGTEIGLVYPPNRWEELARRFDGAAQELGLGSPTAAVQTLVGQALSGQQRDVIANHLTIGETHLFRHQQVFELLSQVQLPRALAVAQSTGRPLRVWSAACCSGEELYSVAILLAEMGVVLAPDAVHLLGTDLCPRSLAKARQGAFTEWSFRDTTEHVRQRYFDRRDNGQFVVRADLAAAVTFEVMNLVDRQWSLPPWGTESTDILLCRNVLLYFDTELAVETLRRLAQFVTPDDGWLIVGSGEAHLAIEAGLEPVSECPVVFRQPRLGSLAARTLPTGVTSASGRSSCQLDSAESLQRARTLADQGELAAAEILSRESLAAMPEDADVHYLLGTILQERGEEESALLSHRRALRLQPDHALASFALGMLLDRRGQHQEARQHLCRAVALLKAWGPSQARQGGLDTVRRLELIEFLESIV